MDKKLKSLLIKKNKKVTEKPKPTVDNPMDLSGMDLTESEKREFEAAAALDKVTKHIPMERRSPIVKIDAECRICKKQEKVHPDLYPRTPREKGEDFNPYVCNSCAGGR